MNASVSTTSATCDAVSRQTNDPTSIRWTHYLHGSISGLLAWLAHRNRESAGILLLKLSHHTVTGPHWGGTIHISLPDVLQHCRPPRSVHHEPTAGPAGTARVVHSLSGLRALIGTQLTADSGEVVLAVLIGDGMSQPNVQATVVQAVARATTARNVRLLDVVAVPTLTSDATWTSLTHPGFAGVIAVPSAVETRTAAQLYGLPPIDDTAPNATALWLPEQFRTRNLGTAQRREAILHSMATISEAEYDAMIDQTRRLLTTAVTALRADPTAGVSAATTLPLLIALDDEASGLAWDMLRSILNADTATAAAYDRLLASLVSAVDRACRSGPAMIAGLTAYLRGDGLTAAALLTLAAQAPDNHWAPHFRLNLMHGTEPTTFRSALHRALHP